MSRPRSENRRTAILDAATRSIATNGLAASTAAIATDAGVSNGSLFVYFETKAALLNALYITLKTEMGAAAVEGLPADGEIRAQVLHMWDRWMRWATSFPEKRRALAHLDVIDDITAESHLIVSSALSGIADLLERSRSTGPMRSAPLGFVLVLVTALAEATIDSMIREPESATAHSRLAFDALWRIVA